MDYELAVKLKEAGFPEITRIAREMNLHRYRPMTPPDASSFPFLQELIAECGENVALWRERYFDENGDRQKAWFATPSFESSFEIKKYADTGSNRTGGWFGKSFLTGYIDDFSISPEIGKTPEEAVANLWLALNKDTK